MEVFVVNNESQLRDAYSVRVKVFVDEQQVPPEEEIDDFEASSTHFVVYDKGKPIGAGRLRELDGYAKVERICIDKEYRSLGIGKLLMEAIEKEAKQQGFCKFKLNAQIQATDFYRKLGYEVCSDEFLDAGIPHVTMKKI
ncbi:GNAT family N-acetyltransferase [Anaerobacillus sp. CMMVII]|uniref:GNAT family N-acetyltransferase n=1 Tax=Anaerobacillus sp. CMMVII TaxID=2755588 RepID=UPI0021B76553|nr:GNAT family N-acetyltransferase [Anaerobacillus sp. CMMVII]MCT8140368.1 GNAT family N-acetyltransferase [Anaerobacillus sp. CMMVII]